MAKNKAPSLDPKASYGLYALAALAAFAPCLFLGQAYFDNDLLAQFGPWRVFLKAQLAQGHFPLWNPYNLGGLPFFADLQNMMAYPFNYPTLLFPTAYGLGVFFALHFFWAAAGMDLWLGSLGLSLPARRLGALLFALSQFFWLEVIHPPILAALSWFPWFFYFLEGWVRGPKNRKGFGAGFSFAMLFLCGSAQMSLAAFYGGAAYFLCRAAGAKDSALKKGGLLSPFLLFLWGSLPLLLQAVPTYELSRLSSRGAGPMDYGAFNARLSLEPLALHQFLFPRLLLPDNTPLEHLVQSPGKDGTFHWAGNWGYLGVWAPLLALGAFFQKDKRLPSVLGGLGILGLAAALGRFTPFHRILCLFLPGFALFQAPFRYLSLFVLISAVLASLGFENLSRGSLKPRLLWVPGSLFLVFSLAGGIRTWRESLALAAGILSLVLMDKGRSWKGPSLKAFQAALLVPLFLNGWADFPTGPSSNYDFTTHSKSLPAIAQDLRPYRVLFGNHIPYPIRTRGKDYWVEYPKNASLLFELKNFSGYNPLALKVKQEMSRFPLALSVQMGALGGIVSMDKDLKIPGFEPKPYPPFTLYRRAGALPLAYAPVDTVLAPDHKAVLEEMQRPGFGLEQRVIFTQTPPGGPDAPGAGPATLSCSLLEEKGDSQTFSISLNRDHWVVFTETAYPGWKAYLDGSPVPWTTVDLSLRALRAPAGTHLVEFRFEPDWAHPLQAFLAAWILGTLFMFWKSWKGEGPLHA